MSDFTQSIAVTIPAGTTAANPYTQQTPLGDCDVQSITLTFPPGCAGLVGATINAAGSPAYPNQPGQYFVFDDYIFEQTVSRQIQSGQWSVTGYNTDTNNHTVQVIFQANYIAAPPGGFSTPLVSL